MHGSMDIFLKIRNNDTDICRNLWNKYYNEEPLHENDSFYFPLHLKDGIICKFSEWNIIPVKLKYKC